MINKLRRTIATILSVTLVSFVIFPAKTEARPVTPGVSSYAFAQQLDLRLLAEAGLLTDSAGNPTGLGVLELQKAQQEWNALAHNDQTAVPQNVNVGVLSLLHVKLGELIIPLVGPGSLLGDNTLLATNLGLLREYAHAPYATEATAAAGLITNEGAINLDAGAGDGANMQVDLTSLLKLDPLIDPILDKAALELGALTATASKPDAFLDNGTVCDGGRTVVDYANLDNSDIEADGYGILDPASLTEDDGKFCSSYQIAKAEIVIDSPLVDDLTSGITNLVSGLQDSVSTLLGSSGVVSSLLGILNILDLNLGPVVTITPSADVSVDLKLNQIINQLTDSDKPLTDSDNIVYLNLGTGEIKIDLDKVHTQGLNNLDPNTPLLTATEITKITNALNNLLLESSADEPNGLNARLEGLLYGDKLPNGDYAQEGGLYAAEVTINLGIALTLLGDTTDNSVNLTSTLGGLLNPAADTTENLGDYQAAPYDYIYLQSSGALYVISSILGELTDITGLVGGVLKGILFGPGGDSGVVGGLLQSVVPLANTLLVALDPLLQGLVRELADVIVNRQKVQSITEGNLFTVNALEVNLARDLLGGTLATLPLATASVLAKSFDRSTLEIGKFVVNDENFTIPTDYTLNYTCTHDDFEEAYEDRFDNGTPPELVTDRLTGSEVLNSGQTKLIENLPAGADCEVDETGLNLQDPTIKWTQSWTDNPNWTAADPSTPDHAPIQLTINGPNFVAVVNRFESAFIDFAMNTAKIGDGRQLHQGGYTYNLQCTLDTWDSGVITINTPSNAVGDHFTFDSGEFALVGATAQGTIPEVLPGATCTVTTTAGINNYDQLRATEGTREPYSYFLTTDQGVAVVANGLPNNSVSVDPITDVVSVSADEVGAGWKTHSYTFTVPADATSHSVNVVHAYDIVTRSVEIEKEVVSGDPSSKGPFDFSYSVDNGNTWTTAGTIDDGESLTISNVPVFVYNSVSGAFEETNVIAREAVPAPNSNGPEVTWTLKDPETVLGKSHDGTYSVASSFSAALGFNAAVMSTPSLELHVKNHYDTEYTASLPQTGRTTLVWVIGLGLLAALGALIMYVRSRNK